MRQAMTTLGVLTTMTALAAVLPAGDKTPAYIDAAGGGRAFQIQGEYEGKIGDDTRLGAHVVALGDGKFDVVFYLWGLPGGGWDRTKVLLKGETKGSTVVLEGVNFVGTIQNGSLTGTGEGGVKFDLKKVLRQSPTLGAAPPKEAIVLFDGSHVDAWKKGRIMEDNLLEVGTRTKQKFRNYHLHLEFRTPFMPKSRGQGRSNSGLYLNDQYECQILDSFGLSGEDNECGGFYRLAKPHVNMCLPPLSWQTYDVDFTAAKFNEEGEKTGWAMVTVRHNGIAIHEGFVIPKTTPGGGQNDEAQPGSIFLQDHGNPVRFRNIWIVEKD